MCFPDCGDGIACSGVCDEDGSCVHDVARDCDASCATFCRQQDAPCGPKARAGRCASGSTCVDGSCISKGCPDWRCTGAECSDLVPMPGATDPTSPEAIAAGYYLASPAKYSFVLKHLAMLTQYVTCEVRYRFPGTKPLGVVDLSQKDGKTPGSDIGRPRHATSTHRGNDIDIAYYQTDDANDPQIICGDGSDTNPNGMAGKYNDGFFCTTKESIVDWPRELWKLAKFAESPKARVFGVDQMLPDKFREGTAQLRESGDVNADVAARMTHIGVGAKGGWQFHHHHTHMSYFP